MNTKQVVDKTKFYELSLVKSGIEGDLPDAHMYCAKVEEARMIAQSMLLAVGSEEAIVICLENKQGCTVFDMQIKRKGRDVEFIEKKGL